MGRPAAAFSKPVEGTTQKAARPSRHVNPPLRGGWVLVGHFEVAGQRYIVAREGESSARGSATLTSREREVMRLAAAGRSSKSIAYDLGIASSTVRVLLARAAHKIAARM